ncbi:MAG: hypothetical protein HY430_03405 [Candidatus Levybacteria bacterium]|nr:hypothetical protein [Candidatus Levybacteria bacterium]
MHDGNRWINTVFGNLAVITGKRDLVLPIPAVFPQAMVTYRRTNEPIDQKLFLADENERDAYFQLMRDPESLSRIWYRVFRSDNRDHLYTFGMDNKTRPWDEAKMRLGLPSRELCTHQITLWALTNHRSAPSVDHPRTAPSLARAINELIAQQAN